MSPRQTRSHEAVLPGQEEAAKVIKRRQARQTEQDVPRQLRNPGEAAEDGAPVEAEGQVEESLDDGFRLPFGQEIQDPGLGTQVHRQDARGKQQPKQTTH